MSIAQNLQHILERIATATQQAGRPEGSVKLIAVSKTKPIELVQEAFAAGQVDFGENKVQEIQTKHPDLPAANWHMIGNLQRNKVQHLLPFVHLIHSVDSERLLARISQQAQKQERIVDCLLQLNISEEDSKSGLNEETGEALLQRIEAHPGIRIKGLMGMAAPVSAQIVQAQFARLRKASERFAKTINHPRVVMQELSMGMSGDFELAIAEGATLVRVGSAVFGARNYG